MRNAHLTIRWLCLCVVGAALCVEAAPAQTIIFAENFDSVTLFPAVTPTRIDDGDGMDYSFIPPAGWTVDNSLHTFGTLEFDGWSFVNPVFWVATAGQDRDQFTKGKNVIAVADPDEWDDDGNPSAIGTFHSFMISPNIPLAGAAPGALALQFDSSWRHFGDMLGTVTVSYNNGPEIEILRLDSTVPSNLNETMLLPLNNPAGATQMRLTWGLIDAGNDWWWAIDNVLVHTPLSVTVDRDTGAISLTNETAQAITISNYSLVSEFGGLNPANWLSIADNYDANGDGSVDAGSSWNRTTALSTTWSEADSSPATAATLAPGQSVVLAEADGWRRSPVEDILLEIVAGDSILAGFVSFTGNGGQSYVPGDLNFDNVIDLADWLIFRQNQHTDLTGLPLADAYQRGDLTGDLRNDHADFVEFKRLFDAANGAGAFAAALAGVPEPSTLIILAAASVPLLWARGARRHARNAQRRTSPPRDESIAIRGSKEQEPTETTEEQVSVSFVFSVLMESQVHPINIHSSKLTDGISRLILPGANLDGAHREEGGNRGRLCFLRYLLFE